MTHFPKTAAACAAIAAMAAAVAGPLAPSTASARGFTPIFRSFAPANPGPRPPGQPPHPTVLRCLPCDIAVGHVNPYDPIEFANPGIMSINPQSVPPGIRSGVNGGF